jgi:adenylate cyclase
VVAEAVGAPPALASCQFRRKACIPASNQHYSESVARRLRVLNLATWMSAVLTGCWGIAQLATAPQLWATGIVNLVSAAIFAMIPKLHRFGELVAPLVFTAVAYVSIFIICWDLGTDSGLQFYFLVAASLVLLVVGIEHIVLASTLAAIGAALTIALQFLVPADTGMAPDWVFRTGFVVSILSAVAMVIAAVWYALREIARAEAAMEREYERSESLLSNILPTSVAMRLKDPSRTLIADKYDEASILFADIAGYTKRASDTSPGELVRFLDRLYTELDRLVDEHGLEKIKTSGDSYMVVSGVPHPRPDHAEALARFALEMTEAVAGLQDPSGRPVPLRIGLGTGPVVAGVVGARKFFYDVWGDAVNVASRMESTDAEGRIQVPQALYERLRDDFVLEERGDVDIKGKGVMHTWYLVSQRNGDRMEAQPARSEVSLASRSSSADVT